MHTDNKIRAIIIDDETNCIVNLAFYLKKYCPDIQVVATADTIPGAAALLQTHQFDLAFCDIEFCGETIFSLFNGPFPVNFAIVFVTAYDNYAASAFKAEAIDYILKPLSRLDIITCYGRIQKHQQEKQILLRASGIPEKPSKALRKKVMLRDRDHVFIVEPADILYLKGMGAYTEAVFLYDGKIQHTVVSKTLSFLEEEYEDPSFFRVHKSYLINLNKVTGIHKKDVPAVEMQNKEVIPVAKRRIHDLLSFLNTTR